MSRLFLCLFILIGGRALAEGAAIFTSEDWERIEAAQVVIAGEVHDNPAHHAVQADLAGYIDPAALVFEMLDESQVEAVTPENRQDETALREALEWETSGWPDFAMYYPIFAAAPAARIYPALVPREAARAVMEEGPLSAFGPEAENYGLTEALAAPEQSAREAMQAAAHCDALPPEMLPGMVEIQRLRDATLARATLQALNDTGGPVLVITGNGHAREDWGMPVYLRAVRPDLNLVTIGQGEGGRAPDGVFDMSLTGAEAPERADPCAAFR